VALVDELMDQAVKRDVHRARTELRRLLGDEIALRPAANVDYLEAAVPAVPGRLVLMAVGNGAMTATNNTGCWGRI